MQSTPPPAEARSLADELFDAEPWQEPADDSPDSETEVVPGPALVGFEPVSTLDDSEVDEAVETIEAEQVVETVEDEATVETVTSTYAPAWTPPAEDEGDVWPDTPAAAPPPKANVTMFPEKKGLFGRRGAPKEKVKKPKKIKKSKKAEENLEASEPESSDF